MGLASVVFTKEPNREFEVDGHKIVVRKLTARDSFTLEKSMSIMQSGVKDFKAMFTAFIDILSTILVSVDGVTPDGKEDAMEFLLNLEQRYVTDIFNQAKIWGDITEEDLKKLEGTPA